MCADLFAHENKETAERDKQNHKYDGYRSLGIRSPALDAILKQYKKDVLALSCRNAFALAMKFYRLHIEDMTMAGNFVMQNRCECITQDQLPFIDRVLDYFGSWSTIDDFCIDVLQPILLKYPREVITLLKRWNTTRSIWKRRASVVAFVRAVGLSGKFTKEALALCENLVTAPEDLVQKGVGWCLKDVMRGDKKKVLDYVKELRQRRIPATITLYAMRDLKGAERRALLSKQRIYLEKNP